MVGFCQVDNFLSDFQTSDVGGVGSIRNLENISFDYYKLPTFIRFFILNIWVL